MALAEIYSNNKCYRTASAIINPIIKRKTDALNRNHNVFAEALFLNLEELKLNWLKRKRTLENKQLNKSYFPRHISNESLRKF
jgi:hypothetical protein